MLSVEILVTVKDFSREVAEGEIMISEPYLRSMRVMRDLSDGGEEYIYVCVIIRSK